MPLRLKRKGEGNVAPQFVERGVDGHLFLFSDGIWGRIRTTILSKEWRRDEHHCTLSLNRNGVGIDTATFYLGGNGDGITSFAL